MGEQQRHDLHTRLEVVLGRNEAATLMEHLPPLGWGDVVTKGDLGRDIALVRRDIDVARAELTAEFRAGIASQTRTLVFTVIASNMAMAGATVVTALVR